MRKQLTVIILVEFLTSLALGILGPFYAVYVDQITGNPLIIGYSYALYSITIGLLSPFFGRISDKYSKKILLVTSAVFIITASIGYALATNVATLLLVEFFSGVATAAFSPVYKTIIAELTTKNNRATEYGLLESVSSITYGLGTLAGTFLIAIFGIKLVFLLSGFFQLATALIMVRSDKE